MCPQGYANIDIFTYIINLFTNQKRQPLSNAQLANETNQQVSKQITQSVLNYLR